MAIFSQAGRSSFASFAAISKIGILVLIILCSNARSVQAQRIPASALGAYMDSLTLPIADTLKSRVALAISSYYYNLPGKIRKYRDSTFLYADKGIMIAERSGDLLYKYTAVRHKASLMLLYRDFKNGIKLFEESMNFFEANNYTNYTAGGYFWAIRLAPRTDETFNFLVRMGEKAIQHYKETKNVFREYLSRASLADVYFKMGWLDQAETIMEAAIAQMEADKYALIHVYYSQLSYIVRYKGNYAKALHYELEAVRKLVLPRDSSHARTYYLDLADLYYNIESKEKRSEYILKSMDYFQTTKPFRMVMKEGLNAIYKDNNPQKALDIVLAGAKKYPPEGAEDTYNLHASLASLYTDLKQYDSAIEHYLKIFALENELNRGMDMNAQYDNYFIAKLYCELNRFEKAEPILYMLLSIPAGRSPLGIQREAHYLQYRVDSAKGSYVSAINHLRKFKELYDIIYTNTKSWQLQELTVKFETELKEQRLKVLADSNRYQESRLRILNDSMTAVTRQREIDDLKRNLELTHTTRDLRLLHAQNLLNLANVQLLSDSISNKARLQALADKQEQLLAAQSAQNIKLLTSEAELNKRKLADAQLRQNLIFIGIVLLLIACGTLAYFYWLKQKNNKRIQATNRTLKRLVEEKEWLVKEVHHRVKNNLHTVVSLLESQSSFLSDEALSAVISSQNRVYAMSLIHQKLYTSENAAEVDMSIYLPELIDYLGQCYEVRNKIRLTHEIASVNINGNIAVPVGLIVNEAVTNAIKYAFANHQSPSVHISLKQMEDNKLKLCISDNGKGISDDAIQNRKSSLGLTLMEGLAQDIGGDLSIINKSGTTICVTFILTGKTMQQQLPDYGLVNV